MSINITESCFFCSSNKDVILLFEFNNIRIVSLKKLHISVDDGGHLIIVPIRHVRTRSELTPEELLTIDFLSIIAAKALEILIDVTWFNYHENGNWSLDTPCLQHAHLHVYGRQKDSTIQEYGESLVFPKKKIFLKQKTTGFSQFQIEKLKKIICDLITSKKYSNYIYMINCLKSSKNTAEY